MTTVAPEWLSLREPADAAARSDELAAIVARRVRPAVVHDLGGGTGAMGRWLAPRLPEPQHWVVHDRDRDLLDLALADPPANATVETRQTDLAWLTPSDLDGADLVVASALLDILTANELTGLLASAGGRPLLVALSVVGRVALLPQEPLDARIGAAFNAHQRLRLGPDAVPMALRALANTGATVLVRPSPWQLGAPEVGLIAEWFLGWVAAAVEQEPELTHAVGAYLHRRLVQAAAGALAVSVGHVDMLVLP
jgi:hypothetical protein